MENPFFNHMKQTSQQGKECEPNAAAMLRIISGLLWGGGGRSTQTPLLGAGLHRFDPNRDVGRKFGCVGTSAQGQGTHPPLHKVAVEPQWDIPVRGS